jgi:hypothetical protein
MFVVCEYNTGGLVSFTVVVYSHVHENTCMTAIIILRGEDNYIIVRRVLKSNRKAIEKRQTIYFYMYYTYT